MKRLILGIFLVVWWCGNLVCAQDIAVKTNLLYWATSTPNIGFEFGLGAEIGISTQKLHARGPMGLKALTTTKFYCKGTGQTR